MFVNRRRESTSINPKSTKVSSWNFTLKYMPFLHKFFFRDSQFLFDTLCPLWLRHVESVSLPSANVTRSPAFIKVTVVVPICYVSPHTHTNGTEQLSGFSTDHCGKGHAVIKFDWKCTPFIFFNLCHTDQQTMRSGCKESAPKPFPSQVGLFTVVLCPCILVDNQLNPYLISCVKLRFVFLKSLGNQFWAVFIDNICLCMFCCSNAGKLLSPFYPNSVLLMCTTNINCRVECSLQRKSIYFVLMLLEIIC